MLKSTVKSTGYGSREMFCFSLFLMNRRIQTNFIIIILLFPNERTLGYFVIEAALSKFTCDIVQQGPVLLHYKQSRIQPKRGTRNVSVDPPST